MQSKNIRLLLVFTWRVRQPESQRVVTARRRVYITLQLRNRVRVCWGGVCECYVLAFIRLMTVCPVIRKRVDGDGR